MRVTKAPEERRAELVAAARLLFDKNGVESTRVSDIVKQVGVAQGVFYYYFTSKDEMVDVVVAEVVREVTARRDAILHNGAGAAAQLREYVQLYADWVDGFLADDARDLGALQTGLLAHNPLAEAGRALLVEGFVALVENAAARGEVRTPCPAQSAKVLLYGIEGLARESLPTAGIVYTLLEQGLGLPPGALGAVGAPV